MSKEAIGFWVSLAWMLAALTVLAALFVCFRFGVVEIPNRYGIEKVVNWPLIIGGVVSAAYAVLFAVAMNVIRISALNSRAIMELMLDKPKANEEDPAES